MALARFFDRAASAVGRHVQIPRDVLADVLGKTAVGVAVAAGPTRAERLTSVLLVDLLARLYPEIRLSGPDDVVDDLRARALAVNPQIGLELGTDEPVMWVGVGAPCMTCRLYVGSSGWVTKLSGSPIDRFDHDNPFSAAAAATLAASQVFRIVFGLGAEEVNAIDISLLDYSGGGEGEQAEAVDLGRVLFAGVGAVGSAALWCLARHPRLTGQIALVDAEAVELSNLQRYVLTTDEAVHQTKVDLGVAEFSTCGSQVQVTPFEQTLEQYADHAGAELEPTICTATDSVDSRRSAQALLPRLLVNGWTSDSGLGASWHEFGFTPCAGCLYHPAGGAPSQVDLVVASLGLSRERAVKMWVLGEAITEEDLVTVATHLGVHIDELSSWRGRKLQEMYTAVVCGAVAFDVRKAGRAEAVPLAHQSALAGVLLAAELVKRSCPDLRARSQPQPLLAWDEVLGPLHGRWPRAVARRDECFCKDPDYTQVFQDRYGITS